MATHLLLADFLDPAEQAHVYTWAHEIEPSLVTGAIYPDGASRPAHRPDFRSCKLTFDTDEIMFHFESRLRTLVPYACERLDVVPFALDKIEYQFTLHEAGDRFGPHIDNGLTAESRVISWVYYMNERYRRNEGYDLERGVSPNVDGGDLMLYPSGRKYGEVGEHDLGAKLADDAVRVSPRDNSLVLFRSNILHEVTVMRPLDARAKRWTVNGWYHQPA